MDTSLLDQLEFARSQTLALLQEVSEETADRLPEGFRNTIRWNAGHIYVIQERLAFLPLGLPMNLPAGYAEQFEYGTSPSTKPETAQMPSLSELKQLLQEQPGRIREALSTRMGESLTPFTGIPGLSLSTPEQYLSFSLYHEGLHVSVIKMYRQLLERS